MMHSLLQQGMASASLAVSVLNSVAYCSASFLPAGIEAPV